MSTSIMYVLLAFYAVIMLVALVERKGWLALYFLGAILISLSVLKMTGKP